MIGGRKKTAEKGLASKKKRRLYGRAGTKRTEEQEANLHKANWQNVAVIVNYARNTVRAMCVDAALVDLFKVVRHWPEQIAESGAGSVDPVFGATEITATQITKDGKRIITAQFTYASKEWEFVYTTVDDAEDEPATITLHENDVRVIELKINQDLAIDSFAFRSLIAFKTGDWIENVLAVWEEIEQAQKKDTGENTE